ncbi:MAG TPA: cupin domain-containing protein [Pseudomonadales bacterium]|nr:cupin domain-containing protein [Pseudomonadales bacterium]
MCARTLRIARVTALTLLASALALPASASEAGFVRMQAGEPVFRPVPGGGGLSAAVLSGDPAAAGIYVLRVRFPPGVQSPPHHHDQDRHVTVIAGTWAFGTGDSGDCADTVPLTAGAYALHPAGAVHFDGSCGNEAAEVQIIGIGPVQTVRADAP